MPQPRVKLYKAKEEIQNPQTGDFILTHGSGVISALIRFGQSLRFRGDDKKYIHWNHAVLILNSHGEIAEALGSGVVKGKLSKYRGTDYYHVAVNTSREDQAEILAFANSVLAEREKYGYITIASIFLTLLFGWKVAFEEAGTAICSGFVSDALVRRGEIFPKPPAFMMPADLAKYFNVPL